MARAMTVQSVTKQKAPAARGKNSARPTSAVRSAVLRTTATGMTPDEIRSLRVQLSPDPLKPLSQQRLSQLLSVSWSTIARWEAGGAIDTRHAQKLVRLRRALTVLDDMVTREYRLAFFEQAHPLLMQLRPIDLLDTEEGAAAVLRQLDAAATGAFS
jgi:DNA-binding transcriptional regulator YiaG